MKIALMKPEYTLDLKTVLKLFLLNNNDIAQDLFRKKKNVESEKRWYKMNL